MNYKSNLVYIFLILIVVIPVKAQSSEINLSGNLITDTKILFEENKTKLSTQLSLQTENKKSPFLAGLLSLVLPGAGEFYSGDYIRTAVFAVIEAAVITTAVIYDNRGDNQTEFFQKYADKNWSVVKYAQWLNSRGANIQINSDESLPPWERVNWSELNAAESEFSHRLPPYGDQQYYELIGKYHQFTAGWDDYIGGNISDFTPHLLYYAHEQAKADDYYNVASKAVIGLYINHFLSVLDAVWVTVDYNKSLAVKMRMEETYFADRMELVPTIKLSFNF